MLKSFLLTLFLACATLVSAQHPIRVIVHHKLGEAPFSLNQSTQNNMGDEFMVTRLQYFMSEFSITHDGGQLARLDDTYVLVNAAESTVIDLGTLPVENVERIDFGLGVPSPENNDDPAQWPAGHALAPSVPSMHWGWAGGYRFVAMEGEAGPTLTTHYEFHPLGNDNYHYARILTGAQNVNDTLVIELDADYAEALFDINVASGIIAHGNLGYAPIVMANFRNRVFTPTNATTSVTGDALRTDLAIFPNPTSSQVTVRLDPGTPGIVRTEILDPAGQVLRLERTAPRNEFQLILPGSGLYLLRLIDAEGQTAVSPVFVR